MSTTLYDIEPMLQERIALFVQANMPLDQPNDERMFLTPIDIYEMFMIMGQEVSEQLMGSIAHFSEKGQQWSSHVGGIKKYRKDTGYHYFWDDVRDTVADMIETVLIRPIQLSGGERLSPHPMCKRFNAIVLPLVIKHLKQFHHETVMIGATRFFEQLADLTWLATPRQHDDDIRVARAAMSSMMKEKHLARERRYELIQRFSEKSRAERGIEL